MLNDKYKSINDIAGVNLPNVKSEHIKCMSDSEVRQVVLEEHYQLVYMFSVYDKLSVASIAEILNCSQHRVKKIMSSYVYKMMIASQWKPANMCRDTVIRWTPKTEDKIPVEDYSGSSMARSLKNYEKEVGIDKAYSWSLSYKKRKKGTV